MNIGKFIAKGKWRSVYEHPEDPTLVIKVLTPDKDIIKRYTNREGELTLNPNKNEYDVWLKYKDTEVGTHLCPVVDISPCHNYLVMKKAPRLSRLPEYRLPKNFKDTRAAQNWGLYEKRHVCIDYGNYRT